jgi:hypothetical protein
VGSDRAAAVIGGLKGRPAVTASELAQTLATYSAGLQAELALLHQLEALVGRQDGASARNDVERLSQYGDERSRLMAALVQIEHDVKPLRETIAARLKLARQIPGFHDVLARHAQARDFVARIIESNRVLVDQLQDAEQARRESAQAIEVGEATLAAYRRVLTPDVSSVGLINRRG